MTAAQRLVAVAAAGVVVLQPAAYAGMFAGDAVIHLAYAERAAAGRFYEFNPGEVSAGVTSPGYMLLLALAFRWLGPEAAPVAAKLAGVAAWYLLALVVWRIARRLVPDRTTAALVGLVAALVPGSAYNATVGMENGLFALAVWTAVLVGLGAGDRPSIARGGAEGLLWALAVWLRPEGVYCAGIWFVLRGAALSRGEVGRPAWTAYTAGLAVVAVSAALLAWFQFSTIGTLVPGSARARIWLGTLDAIRVGPIVVDPRLAVRLAGYLPLTVLGLVGTFAVLRRRRRHAGETAPQHSGAWRFVAVLFWSSVALYSTVVGTVHLARYAIFLMPALCLLAGRGLDEVRMWPAGSGDWRGQVMRHRSIVASLAAAWLVVVFGVEVGVRRTLGGHDAVRSAMRAPGERTAATDRLLADLGAPAVPLSIALVEVQLRYALDERIVVRSLDGRTDPVFLEFVGPSSVDYLGYLRRRQVDVLLEFPDDNRDPDAWSPRDALALGPGASDERGGLILYRPGEPAIVRIRPAGSGS